jgi:putative aldouronate transport system substrate-binding protein
MKQMSKVFFSVLLVVFLVTVPSCKNKQGTGNGESATTQVSGIKLTVTPQYGDQKFYPQPATSYSANPAYPQQPPYSNVNGFPITQNKTTLKVSTPYHSYVMDYENNDLTKYMEELTNIHVDWDLLPEFDTLEKINLVLSAGDNLPDVFYGAAIPTTMLITLGSGKLIIPLQDLIEKNAYNMKLLYEERPNVYPTMISADGNIYSLAGYSNNEPNQLAMRFWINKPFLDKLGMKVPATTDELYQYLKAVKTQDPNGNGRADEIPLVGDTEGWYGNVDGFLMNAFIFNETSNDRNPIVRRRVFLTKDGKIDVSFNKSEWRQGLEYMNKLYSEGLLAGESFTLKKEDLRAIVEKDGAPVIGAITNGGVHNFSNVSGERRKDWMVIPPLTGPNGLKQIYYDEYAGPTVGRYLVTKDCKIPDIAIKWADSQFTPDFATRNRYGVLDRDWRIPPAGTPGVDGDPAKYEEILKWGTPQTAYWGVNTINWQIIPSHMRGLDLNDPYELEFVLWNAYVDYLPYANRQSVPKELAFTTAEARRYAELNRLIIEYVEQSLAGFVTGRLNINTGWDKYLSDLNTMGLTELIQLTQSAFDRTWKEALGY